ncbi:MAG TPA: DUF4097 family beta strand repeat-containing protein [Bryobacteraceae bacterium]|nr:DUF4097 family beta strand repeat-containing protein [Bryobacteraceae bacterium]
MRLRTVVLTALAAVLPLQLGCDFESWGGDSERFKEDFQYSRDLEPGGRVSLETFNGSVEIISWEKPYVQITGTKYAAIEDDMKNIKIDVQGSGGSVQVKATRPVRRGNMGARFVLRVPREVELERIASSNGSIRVEDIKGNARLETSNGSVKIRKFDGRLNAHTSNSGIECFGLDGEAMLRSSNGRITIQDGQGTLEAETSNSAIQIDMFEPKAGTPVRLTTSNGSIEATFEQLEADVRASTSNSSITVRLPSNIKARIRANTSNGAAQTDFDVDGSIGKHSIEGSVNGGGPLVHLTSSNGAVRVLKM